MKIVIEHDYTDIKKSKYYELIVQYKKTIKECVTLCLQEEKIITRNVELYIRYTNNDEIKIVNKKYRNIDKETDVLSFPMYDDFSDYVKEQIMHFPIFQLGDIIISIEKIEEQSLEYGHTFERELIYLITHAMFHLLGYDHIDENDKKIMRQKEEIIMESMNIIK